MSADGPAVRRLRRPKLREVGEDPDYRYSLANERTFLSWVRTSLAILAGGVAVIQLAPDLGPRSVRLAIGIALIVIAGALAAGAHRRWASAERAMRLGVALPSSPIFVVLGYGIAVVVVTVLVVLIAAGRA